MSPNIAKKLLYTWSNMKNRCYNQKSPKYKTYGGRGVKIEWSNFQEFANDMRSSLEEAYKNGIEKISIDRIDNDKNYSKENCRWISISENSSLRHKGVAKTTAHKLSMSLDRKGKQQTEARTAVLKKIHESRKKPVVQKCKSSGDVISLYESIKEAALKTGVPHQNINDCALGKRKSAGGYAWEYMSVC